ncbi:hypothetical protein OAL71_01105 [Phycisphaerales bacterium]|nr:hypothetical protein [Phycisphaerales bacterium]RPG16013.1 MAG: hypothetical protein CBB69_009345 [Phycisphaera sp. TMED9]
MFVVDANVLAIAADRQDPGHDQCRARLDLWRAQPGPWYLTWPIVFEFLALTTHPGIYRQPWTVEDSWKYVEAILAAPSLSMISAGERHQEILDQLLTDLPDLRGAQMHETQIAATMIEHGVRRIVTRDALFHRFPMLEVVDPLRAA